MFSKKYRLSYLPLFYEDLDEKITYIAEKLKNPKAANGLLDKVESAIMERLPLAESFEPYHSARERRYSYYRIYVDNYIIYIEGKFLLSRRSWCSLACFFLKEGSMRFPVHLKGQSGNFAFFLKKDYIQTIL